MAIIGLSEREETEAALRRSQARYRTLFDLVPVAVYTCDAEGLLVEFNRRAEELWGRKPKTNDPTERFCGSFKIFYPDGRPMPHSECPMARVLRGENLGEKELEILVERGTGERRNVAVSPTALRNERGKIVGAINCLFDITKRKQTEQSLSDAARQRDALYQFALRRQEAKSLKDIYNAALDAIFGALACDRAAILLFDDKGVMRFVTSRGLSERYRKAAEGHSPWRGKKRPQLFCVEDVARADMANSLKSALKAEGIGALAFIPLFAEGKLIGKFMIYYDAPHVFSRKEIDLSLNVAVQLALGLERKRAEQALRESEELHRAFVSQTAVGMARSDLKGRLVFVNKKFCDLVGYKESELIGKKIADLTFHEYRARSGRRFRRLVRGGTPFHWKNGTSAKMARSCG